MSPSPKPRVRWDDLDAHAAGHVLAGQDRLIAFFRWLRREGAPGTEFRDRVSGIRVEDVTQVNWAGFSLEDAVAAVAQQSKGPRRDGG